MRFDAGALIASARILLMVAVAATLAACSDSQSGIQSGARSKYRSIAVVPQVNDSLTTVYRPNAFTKPILSSARLGWDAAAGTGQISREVLGASGASVSVASSADSAAARAAEIVVVLQQTPLDQFASTYEPGRDLLFGVISLAGAARAGGLAVITIDNPGRYRPRSILEIADTGNYCAVGITPKLIDPATGEVLRQSSSLLGVEKLPGSLSGSDWASLSPKERNTVLAYCQSALRRVVSKAFNNLNIVD